MTAAFAGLVTIFANGHYYYFRRFSSIDRGFETRTILCFKNQVFRKDALADGQFIAFSVSYFGGCSHFGFDTF